MGIKALEQRIEGLEIDGSKSIKLSKPLVLLVALLDELSQAVEGQQP